jgi:NAD(P)-dependent dehydrogenase (short-subunit alcohol dehydrogenase family)
VNVCSIESFIALPNHVAYTVSKTALLMLTRAFAFELAPAGIRVVGVAPGVTETGMNADLRGHPTAADRLRGKIPLGRFADPEEIANVVAFLASQEASYITGSVVLADGGMHVY